MATYGREKEVGEFLSKLKINDYPKEKIEVIIVDQNDKIEYQRIAKIPKGEYCLLNLLK